MTTLLKKTRVLDLLKRQQLEEARSLAERALSSTPTDASWWGLLGVIHGMRGNPGEAERCARKAVQLKPDYVEAYNNLGLALRLQGRNEEAIAPLREAIRLKPDYADAHYNLGVALATELRLDEAIEAYQHALDIQPDDPEALNNMANLLVEIGMIDDAIGHYRRAIQVRPDFTQTHYNLGNACLEYGRFDLAISSFQQALRIDPQYAEAMTNLGVALEKAGRMEESIIAYRKALEIQPNNVNAHFNLGNVLRGCGHMDEAANSYLRAIALDPKHADAHYNLSLVYLARGNFKDGWKEYAWQRRRTGMPSCSMTLTPWNGSNLGGRNVFIYPEQGLGDEIFFLRFAPAMKQRGAGCVTYRASLKIASILGRVTFIDRTAAPDELPAADDAALMLSDLPSLLESIGTPPPYPLFPLSARMETVRRHLAELGPPPYVGVTWRAGTSGQELLLFKESPLTEIAQCMKAVPATIVVLQRLPAAGEIDQFAAALGRPVHDLSALNDDLESMLALLALLDDYVGVSNTNMHLRAAVGKTARVLVPAPPEWRWMAEGKESPWFPGFSVYRQGYDGSWEGALAELRQDLHSSFGS